MVRFSYLLERFGKKNKPNPWKISTTDDVSSSKLVKTAIALSIFYMILVLVFVMGDVPMTKAVPLITDHFPDYVCNANDTLLLQGTGFNDITPRIFLNGVQKSGANIGDTYFNATVNSTTATGSIPVYVSNGGGVSNIIGANVLSRPDLLTVSPQYINRTDVNPEITLTYAAAKPLLFGIASYSLIVDVMNRADVVPTFQSANVIRFDMPDYSVVQGFYGIDGVYLQSYNMLDVFDSMHPYYSSNYAGTICTSTNKYIRYYPYIDSISSMSGDVGDVVALNGTDFRSRVTGIIYDPIVKFGAVDVTPEAGFSMNNLNFTVPNLAPGTYPVQVFVNGIASTNSVNFTINGVPTTGVLNVIKEVDNTGGGSALVQSFQINVKSGGFDVFGSPGVGSVPPGMPYTLSAGTYVVSEDFADPEYSVSFSGDCNAAGVVNIAAGDNKTCTVTNTYILPPPPPGLVPALPVTMDCHDVKGKGKEVIVSGVPNSGIIEFDSGDGTYGVCVVDPGLDGDAPFYTKGWAWNDNLGWVSFYCGDEDGNGAPPYTNMGIGCGNYEYVVSIDEFGAFDGYAYGDGFGYIAMNNPGASTQLRLEPDDPECQGYIYGYAVPGLPNVVPGKTCSTALHHGANVSDGHKYTYVWSDNVGWIDLDTVLFPWFKLVQEVEDPQVQVTLSPNPNIIRKVNDNVPTSEIPGNGYFLQILINTKDGLPLVDSRYDIVVEPVWAKDTVKKDQTDDSLTLASLDPCASDLARAVSKPCFQSDLDHVSDADNWSYMITSQAPTSNMNGIVNADDVMEFSYEDFVSPDMHALEANDLIFRGMEIGIFDNDANVCIYGDNAACAEKEICADVGCDVSLKFRPNVEITTFEQAEVDFGNENVLEMSVGVPEAFNMVKNTLFGLNNAQLFTRGIDNSDPQLNNINFVNNDGGDGVYDFTDTWDAFLNGGFTAALAQKAETEVPTNFGGLYIYSTISDLGGVKYYSNKLPRELGSSGVQPVAELKGNVYTSGSSKITTAVQAIRSLGDVSTNILRDTIFRNVSSIVAGAVEPNGVSATLVGTGANTHFGESPLPVNTDAVIELMPDVLGNSQVYYAKGDVHIGLPGSTVTWTGNRTVIVIGGNVYIDANLYNTGVNPKPKLGIIALKDLGAGSQDGKGHVYIEKGVTNIQANIFADGSVFSYEDVKGLPDPLTGEPAWGSLLKAERSLSRNQLLIEGSVASQNTVGGSGLATPIKGDGTAATGIEQARLYDLNFLRYYTGLIKKDDTDLNSSGVVEVICRSGGADEFISSEVDYKSRLVDGFGKPISVYDGGCLWPPEDIDSTLYKSAIWPNVTDYQHNLAATYINFDPPSADLPGFTGGRGVDVQVRPR